MKFKPRFSCPEISSFPLPTPLSPGRYFQIPHFVPQEMNGTAETLRERKSQFLILGVSNLKLTAEFKEKTCIPKAKEKAIVLTDSYRKCIQAKEK